MQDEYVPQWLEELLDRSKTLLSGYPKEPRSTIMSYDDHATLVDTLFVLGTAIQVEYATLIACAACPACQAASEAVADQKGIAADTDISGCDEHQEDWQYMLRLKQMAFSLWLSGVEGAACNHEKC